MNVSTIEIPKEEALTKLAQYRGLNRKQIQPEDERLAHLYRMVSKGGRVIDINAAFRATGLNERGWPKLGIARADWRDVFFQFTNRRGGEFRGVNDFWRRRTELRLPDDTFSSAISGRKTTPVPHIPANIRPKIALTNFHILFEVDEWKEPQTPIRYSRDPFLLRHISGSLYVVIAEWDLTELEASLLGSMRNGN